jgi:predicted O-methyltransferase YrrM
MKIGDVYLDSFAMRSHVVGYGVLGMAGSLGYENKMVSVHGNSYAHAFSAHPPARLTFQIDGRFRRFRCGVGLNDDVPAGRSHADFVVLADGRQVAAANFVVAGEAPRELCADIAGAQSLELVTQTSRWEYCHAVWLDPEVSETERVTQRQVVIDCLRRAEIALSPTPLGGERCVATVVSPAVVDLLDDMLGSLYANGCCQDILLVVFALDPDEACLRVAAKYRAHLVHCRSLSQVNATSKSLLYSAAMLVDAKFFLCLDADLLVLGKLRPVFAALEAFPAGTILACREGNGNGLPNLGHAYEQIYWGNNYDRQHVFGVSAGEAAYPLVVNDGLFAGSREALLALDGVIRAMPGAPEWINQHPNNWWRNQFIFNLALARLGCGIELDPTYNVQLHVQNVQFSKKAGRLCADWHGQPARVVHLSGCGRSKYPEWRGLYARAPEVLAGAGDGDGYAVFLESLRAWIGRQGLRSMAWSFYGTTDGTSASVRDPSMLPLLAALHYLIRANGCVRVLETGTARGVSAACLASAVAHRPGGRVVTFDPFSYPERVELWAMLPDALRDCIEERRVGALEGMATALQSGERYEGALLDSTHGEEHVWAEFQLAAQLVCPCGLILIHDPRYALGTVEQALIRIEAAEYNVSRLWAAESGVAEDDHLGLALIVNSRRIVQKNNP